MEERRPINQEIIEDEVRSLVSLPTSELSDVLNNPAVLHRKLFENSDGLAGKMAGVVREKENKSLSLTEGRVLYLVEHPSGEIFESLMSAYKNTINRLANRSHPLEPMVFVADLSAVLFYLLKAHPFHDGNGRVARLIIRILAERFGQGMNSEWTIEDRPYDRHFLYSLRHFHSNPYLLIGCMMDFVNLSESSDSDDKFSRVATMPKKDSIYHTDFHHKPDKDADDFFDSLYSWLST